MTWPDTAARRIQSITTLARTWNDSGNSMPSLIRSNVDVIVTHGTPGSLAVKQATTTIPIVMAIVGDPVDIGIVTSLPDQPRTLGFRRFGPGGAVTGPTAGLWLLFKTLKGRPVRWHCRFLEQKVFRGCTEFLFDRYGTVRHGKRKMLIQALPLYSVRLVLGIINQSIQAIEITLGLGDKRSELKARGARK